MLTVKIFIVLNILIFSGDIFGQQLVVEISNCKIYDHQLKKSDKLAPQIFYKKFGFLPSSNTTEGLESLKHNLRLYKLKTVITNKILQNLEKKYFNKVVTQEDINDFLLKNQRNIAEDIKHDRLFLEAYKELKTSQLSDEKKYKLIYEKYHKMGLKNSFNFFKSSISNEDYIKFINERLKSYSLDNISQMQKTALFRQKLPKYVLHQLSTHDATTKEHIKLAEKHKCNFNDMLYMKWFIDEGNKMNFKVFDKQYGVSLEEILTTPTNYIVPAVLIVPVKPKDKKTSFCLPADEIPPYSSEFDALAEKPGCTGAQVFARPEWRKFFAAAKNDPKRFEFLLTRFSVSQSTQIHICNWENASQGVLAVMAVEIITGRSWMDYDGANPDIKNYVELAKTTLPRHRQLKKILADPVCRRELQNFFRRAYHGQKQPEIPQTQNKIPAAVMKKAEEPPRSEYISREKALEIARKANMMNYDKSQEIRIYLAGGIYTIIFPIKLPPGALGPDYAAKIEIDAKSGKVISVMAGS